MLEIRRLPFRRALEMVIAGEIRDAFTQVMLMKVDALGRRGELPEPVARALGYPPAQSSADPASQSVAT